jgi:hypothetical protein
MLEESAHMWRSGSGKDLDDADFSKVSGDNEESEGF